MNILRASAGRSSTSHRNKYTREREQTGQSTLAEHVHTHSRNQQNIAHRQPGEQHGRPGTVDAAHRHARAGLRERNGPKPSLAESMRTRTLTSSITERSGSPASNITATAGHAVCGSGAQRW